MLDWCRCKRAERYWKRTRTVALAVCPRYLPAPALKSSSSIQKWTHLLVFVGRRLNLLLSKLEVTLPRQ
jgi:hypothetical protein